jgi:Asp-tRNA(Asn)/Glu-tRNA(Gln) amidotransferase A subunit family amidase
VNTELSHLLRHVQGGHGYLNAWAFDSTGRLVAWAAPGDPTEAEAAAARRARDDYRRAAAEALDGVDLLLTPTLTSVAPPVGIGDAALREGMIRLTYPFNALGWPALALPCGDAEDGLPASVQIVGRPGADALVVAAARRLESLVRGTPERG